ncbi:MAG: DNA adenine methylase [Thermotogota bacterium]
MFYSPLRYPGGKTKLTPYILEILRLNNLQGGTYVEPFAGGAGIAWYLLLEGYVKKVFINDLDSAIFSFWYSVLKETDQLCKLIEDTPITIEEWHRQKNIYNANDAALLEKGFATLFLNRTNRSGILKGGVIGGLSQESNYKLDCRFNKKNIINKICKIANKRDNIYLTNLNALDFMHEVLPSINQKSLINIDPPYYNKGKGLYENFFIHSDHYELYKQIKKIKQPWIVTYDDTPEINDLYNEFSPRHFSLSYTAQKKRKGSEIIIHDPALILSINQPSLTLKSLYKQMNNEEKLFYFNKKSSQKTVFA